MVADNTYHSKAMGLQSPKSESNSLKLTTVGVFTHPWSCLTWDVAKEGK